MMLISPYETIRGIDAPALFESVNDLLCAVLNSTRSSSLGNISLKDCVPSCPLTLAAKTRQRGRVSREGNWTNQLRYASVSLGSLRLLESPSQLSDIRNLLSPSPSNVFALNLALPASKYSPSRHLGFPRSPTPPRWSTPRF
jgi:hypothetical protein